MRVFTRVGYASAAEPSKLRLPGGVEQQLSVFGLWLPVVGLLPL